MEKTMKNEDWYITIGMIVMIGLVGLNIDAFFVIQ